MSWAFPIGRMSLDALSISLFRLARCDFRVIYRTPPANSYDQSTDFSTPLTFLVSTLSWALREAQRRTGYLGVPTLRVPLSFPVLGVRGGVPGP